ncbi:MAG: hypothetical protein A2W03_04535 [Candidatus Aminicenantes bacterium RBG_16_63_16]|nr:MAG: hypothetical protein A2W03_04535 [Candidatus Aminicenantes bacterium RBG_16_63_16]
MKKRWTRSALPLFIAVSILLASAGGILFHTVSAQPAKSARDWSKWVIPLPKKMDIPRTGAAAYSPDEIFLTLPRLSDPLLETAGRLLRRFARGSRGFQIRLTLTDGNCPEKLRLAIRDLPNRDQAYAIEPFFERGRMTGLILAANTPLGLLYAARTLDQLVAVPEGADRRIDLPEATIVDWPDLVERGEWGGNAAGDLAWLAERKLNVIEVHPKLGFNPNGSPSANLDPGMLAEGARVGVKIVPIILHLEQLAGTGLFRYHPETAATPDPAKPLPTDYTPGVCFSKPKTVDLLAGWMGLLLDLPGVSEVDVWLSEVEAGCFCPDCRGQNPFAMETRGIITAFEKARPARPRASLRILLTQASYDSNDKVLQAVRPDTKIIYYDGGRTYDSSHKPMIYPRLADFARDRWLGVYPQLTNSWRTVFPFSGPQFILARMREFVGKRLASMIGYATPSNRYYDFNVTAAAEWSWSSRGRSVREFAEAYATRRGIPQPSKFAQWLEKAGEVGWKLAGSRSVERLIFGAGGQTFVEGRIQAGSSASFLKGLKFGGDLFTEFADGKDFGESLVQARIGHRLAQETGDPRVTDESECVLGMMEFLAALKECADAWQAAGAPDKAALEKALRNIDLAAKRLTASVYRWGVRANPAPRPALPSRFRDSVDFAASTADQEWRLAAAAGIQDPQPEYRRRPALAWTEKDFAGGPAAVLQADITDLLRGAGEYDVTLQFLEGASGVSIRAVSLSRGVTRETAPAIDEDRWDFQVGRWNNYVDYWLTLTPQQAAAAKASDRYFLNVELLGPSPDLPAGRRTTFGFAAVRRSWRSGERPR